jgi:hypothetical protein
MVFTLLVALSELATAEIRAAGYRAAPVRIELVQGAPQERTDGSFQVGEQLHNPRTGVTCTMRILKAEPIDKGAVIPSPEQSVDPEIRGSVSPCLD